MRSRCWLAAVMVLGAMVACKASSSRSDDRQAAGQEAEAAASRAEQPNPFDLSVAAESSYHAGDFAACARSYEQAAVGGWKPETSLYNAACCAARAGDAKAAFAYLSRAVDDGFMEESELRADADLRVLHADPRWTALLEDLAARRERWLRTINRELHTMYSEDQADRAGPVDWERVAPRDAARLARVKELVEADALEAADDYFHAAMILQHSLEPDDYRLAHELAARAIELGSERDTARWLVAAAKDRYLINAGQPQIYGTQYRKLDGKWTLEPFDRDAVSDIERARSNVPPIREAEKREAEMNVPSPEAAADEGMCADMCEPT